MVDDERYLKHRREQFSINVDDQFQYVCFDAVTIFEHIFFDEDERTAIMLFDVLSTNCFEFVHFEKKDIVAIFGYDKAILFQLRGNPLIFDGAKYVVFQLVQRALLTFNNGTWSVKTRYVPVKTKYLKETVDNLPSGLHDNEIVLKPTINNNNEGCFCTAYTFHIYQQHPQDPTKTELYTIDSTFDGFTADFTILDFVIKDVTAGNNHAILVDTDGRLHVNGCGIHGELGLGPSITDAKEFIFAENIAEQIPDGISKVLAGNHFNAVLTFNGDVFVWGWNRVYGDLPGVNSNVLMQPVPLELIEDATDISINNVEFVVYFDENKMIFKQEPVKITWSDDDYY